MSLLGRFATPSRRPSPLVRRAPRPSRAGAARGSNLQVAQRDPAEHHQVAVGERRLLHALAVDESPVGAAVVEDARAGGIVDEPRMATRDRVLVKAQVRREAATYA